MWGKPYQFSPSLEVADALARLNALCESVSRDVVSSEIETNQTEVNQMGAILQMDATGMFGKMFGKIAPGMCRLSMSGSIAVKTNGGYKTYNLKNNKLTNCSNFVIDVADDMFFVIPTNKVEPGDIILVSGKPRCVIEAEKNKITVVNYEDATIDTILPERHMFMGSQYFYGKIVSIFGSNFSGGKKKKGGFSKIMKYMLISSMFKGDDNNSNPMGSMLPFMMMSGGNFDDLFGDVFDFDDDDVDLLDDEEEETEEE